MLNCTAGPLQVENINAMATRKCGANLDWNVYDGTKCATLDTARLRSLAEVRNGPLKFQALT